MIMGEVSDHITSYVNSLFPSFFKLFHQFGMYVVRFYKGNQFEYVIIDDRLPVNEANALIYARSYNNEMEDEYWVSLIEKAYAKLFGSYQSLMKGTIEDALYDLSGYLVESVKVTQDRTQEDTEKLWSYLTLKSNDLIGCA